MNQAITYYSTRPTLRMDRPELKRNPGAEPQSLHLRAAVLDIQSALLRHGLPVILDGQFGPGTETAVRSFQRSQGLEETGAVDSLTWSALFLADRKVLRLYDGFDFVSPEVADDVRELQAMLMKKGFPVRINGKFDPSTHNAVVRYQEAEGVEVDGVVGRITWARLFGVGLRSTFLKDNDTLRVVPLRPANPIQIDSRGSDVRRRIAETYNRLGGLMSAIGQELGISTETVVGVFFVESRGRTHSVDRAVLRFENHLFFHVWGKYHPDTYNQHFQHGGQNGVTGEPWQHHKFRDAPSKSFQSFHGNQEMEYRALSLASRLAQDREPALISTSIGGPQISLGQYRIIGYTNPAEMFGAFQKSEGKHVIGFFDFCAHVKAPQKGALVRYLRQQDWRKFTRYYNGSGQVDTYSSRIRSAVLEARRLGI